MKKLRLKIIGIIAILFLATTVISIPVRADYYSERILLYYGMRGSEVVRLQNDLKSLGYFWANSTGYFGSITKQAVINYQLSKGLVADGIVGKNTSREIKLDKIIKTAKSYQGIPYVWGGASPSGFDCSGFIYYVMQKNGITVPRTSSQQYYNAGTWVSKSNLKRGDLVFFTTYKAGPSHVGIYIGNNQFIHASSGSGKIIISSMSNPYFAQRYIGAKRVIS